MANVPKNGPEVSIQLPETKVVSENGVLRSPEHDSEVQKNVSHRRKEVMNAVLRLLCLFTSVTALSLMVTAKQASTISLYGFSIPVYSNWSFSESLEYLVGVCTAVTAHSLLQLLIIASRMFRKCFVIPSRNPAWLIFGADQIFAFAMMGAGSAASGVSNLNRTGIRHSPLPNFCKPLSIFCDRVALSIAFTFFSFFLLSMSVVLDVLYLSKY